MSAIHPRLDRKRTAALVLFILLAGTLTSILWPRLIVSALKQIWPEIVWDVTTSDPVMALTFDDGPDPTFTPQVLSYLEKEKIPATFFLVGQRARQYPELVRAIVAAGHEIGNHSDSHRRTIGLAPTEFEAELLRADEVLRLYQPTLRLFRPAGIWARGQQLRTLKKNGYVGVLGSSFAFDPLMPPPWYIAWGIERGFHPGAILVLHDSGGDRSNTVAALPKIVEAARRKGLRFVTLSNLIERSR